MSYIKNLLKEMKNEITDIPGNIKDPEDKYPFPAPFILSSVERDLARKEAIRIRYIKRRHLEENIKTFASEIGMGEDERGKFLDYWCSPSRVVPEMLRAELDECFDLYQRAVSWTEKAKSANKPQQQSRVEKYAESARQFFQGAQAVPAGPSDPQGFGYADIPDEQ